MSEEEDLMHYEVKSIINETILNLNYAIHCGFNKDALASYIASFQVVDGSNITTECFNASDAYKLIKDRHVT